MAYDLLRLASPPLILVELDSKLAWVLFLLLISIRHGIEIVQELFIFLSFPQISVKQALKFDLRLHFCLLSYLGFLTTAQDPYLNCILSFLLIEQDRVCSSVLNLTQHLIRLPQDFFSKALTLAINYLFLNSSSNNYDIPSTTLLNLFLNLNSKQHLSF